MQMAAIHYTLAGCAADCIATRRGVGSRRDDLF